MDGLLKRLADASLEVAAAEEAVQDDAFHTARERLDGAEAVLADLREQWPAMSQAERGVVGPAAKAVKDRADAAGRRIPKPTALSQGAPVADPEQDEAPE
jgi:hypothetical protein